MYATIIEKKSKKWWLLVRKNNVGVIYYHYPNYHIALTDKKLLEQVERDPVVAEGPNCPPAKLT